MIEAVLYQLKVWLSTVRLIDPGLIVILLSSERIVRSIHWAWKRGRGHLGGFSALRLLGCASYRTWLVRSSCRVVFRCFEHGGLGFQVYD